MSSDPLKQLLQKADALAGDPPEMPADLARCVRRLAARRRRMDVGWGAAAAILLAVWITLLWSQTPVPSQSPHEPRVADTQEPQPTSDQIQAEIARLRREADTRLVVVRRTEEILKEMRRFDELKRQPAWPDAIANARREVDQAAYVLVSQADRMCRELDLCESAAVKYRRVVELFPETRWATVARQRLNELEQRGDVS
jgi:hypothetical protein